MDDGAAASRGAQPPRRRLPTKTSSGRIAPPVTSIATGLDDSSQHQDSGCCSPRSPRSYFGLSASAHANSNLCNLSAACADRELAVNSARSESCDASAEATCRASGNDEPMPESSSTATTFRAAPLPRPVPPQPLATGALNSSSSVNVVALPVKRRGSYQNLKRNVASVSDTGDLSSHILKRVTHWERFGTIQVLCCLSGDQSDDRGAVMQLLMAEGWDTAEAGNLSEAVAAFGAADVFPDIVLIDCDQKAYGPMRLIPQLRTQNPTVAIICLGSVDSPCDAVTALQAGATDYMRRPFNSEELMARIERHVQRTHCIKLELEAVMEQARSLLAQVQSAASTSDANLITMGQQAGGPNRLISVAETDFEQQITELYEENQRLGTRLQDMEKRLATKISENGRLVEQLEELEVRVCETVAENSSVSSQL